MQNATKKKRAAIFCTLGVLLVAAVYLAIALFAMVASNGEEAVAYLVVGIYVLVVLAIMGGVLYALRLRLKEIEGGEEDDARKY